MIDVAQLDCMLAYNTGITSYMLTGLKPHEIRKKYLGFLKRESSKELVRSFSEKSP